MNATWTQKDLAVWKKINAIDFADVRAFLLEEIKTNAVLKKFVPRARKKWILNAEEAYKKFLFVCYRYPEQTIVPNHTVDAFWHKHILFTKSYVTTCQEIFGRYLHHTPDSRVLKKNKRPVGSRAYQKSMQLFSAEFGKPERGKAKDCTGGGSCGGTTCETQDPDRHGGGH